MYFSRIPKPRKDSSSTTLMTLRRRSEILSSVRENVSGGTLPAKRQLAHEVHRTTPEERQELLRKAKITPTVTEEEGLAMKADLSIPWSKLRHLRRYEVQFCAHTNTIIITGGFLSGELDFKVRQSNGKLRNPSYPLILW